MMRARLAPIRVARAVSVVVASLALALPVAGCGDRALGSGPSGTLRASRPVDPSTVPAGSPVTGTVPQKIIDTVRADAAGRSGVDARALTLVRAEAVTWNDGSRGCPQPGVGYTQAIVEGYWIVLEAAGTTLDYRVSREGDVRRCEQLGHAGSSP